MVDIDSPCPRCRGSLQPAGSDQWRCPSCGGIWLARAAVVHLLAVADRGELTTARPASYRTAAHVPSQPHNGSDAEAEIRYLPCPSCEELMLRTRFVQDEPAVADVCVLHGVWFDRGELEQTVESLSKLGPGCCGAVRRLIADHFEAPRPAGHPDSAG